MLQPFSSRAWGLPAGGTTRDAMRLEQRLLPRAILQLRSDGRWQGSGTRGAPDGYRERMTPTLGSPRLIQAPER